MTGIEAVATAVRVEAGEIRGWIAAGWVRPVESAGGYRFDPADIARLHLIAELRRDLLVEEDTVPLVLSLLDQVYGLRRRLSTLARAVEAQPEPVRRAIAAMIAGEG